MPQLDALRGLAVAAVVVSHLGVKAPIVARIGWGEAGVELFFVLSGYLITGILLQARSQLEAGAQTGGEAVRQFFLRRFLRIFPIYYLTLAVTAVIGIYPVRQTLKWHLLYLSNFFFAISGQWFGPISHLWSLAVEEQFYLVWPWLILFLPRRGLRNAILLAIAVGPAYRLMALLVGVNVVAIDVVPFACLDSLGLGSLLAYFRWAAPEEPLPFFSRRSAGWIAFVIVITIHALSFLPPLLPIATVGGRFARAFLFGWLVQRAAVGFRGAGGALLSFRPLGWIGRVSYGIYLFHNFTFEIEVRVLHYAFGMEMPTSLIAQRLSMTLGTLVAAAISWRYFEGPINRFKERFHGRARLVHEPAVVAGDA